MPKLKIASLFRKFEGASVGRQIVSVAASLIVFCLSAYSAFHLKDFSASPKFDLHISLKVPKSGLEVEVYLNRKGELFGESKVGTDNFQTHIFKNLPRRIDMIRIDPAHKAKLPIVLSDIRIKTSSDYRLDPNRDIYIIDVSDWEKWHLFDVKPYGAGSGFVSTTNYPKILIPLKLNFSELAFPFDAQRNWIAASIAASVAMAGISLFAFIALIRMTLSGMGVSVWLLKTEYCRLNRARFKFLIIASAAGFLPILLTLHTSSILVYTIAVRPYIRVQLTLENLDRTSQPVNRIKKVILNKDLRKIIYPDHGDIEFNIHDIPNIIGTFHIEVPSDKNSVISIRNFDFVITVRVCFRQKSMSYTQLT